jgi:hypothetical protein
MKLEVGQKYVVRDPAYTNVLWVQVEYISANSYIENPVFCVLYRPNSYYQYYQMLYRTNGLPGNDPYPDACYGLVGKYSEPGMKNVDEREAELDRELGVEDSKAMPTEYHVAIGYEPMSMAEEVKKRLRAGWVCEGGVCVAQVDGRTQFYQALTKELVD